MELTDPIRKGRPLAWGAWVAAALSERNRLAVHRRFVGAATRVDGWSCRGRRVDAYWLLLAIDGRCVATVGGRETDLDPGMLLLVPPGVRHDMNWSRRFRYAEAYFSLSERGHRLDLVNPPRRVRDAMHHRRAIDRLADEVQLPAPLGEWRVRTLLAGLVIDLLRSTAPEAPGPPGLTRRQQGLVLDAVRERGASAVTPRDLARAAGLSPDYLSRVFKRTFGRPPRVWLARRRLDEAAALLEQTDLPVGAVAERVGFADAPQFSRQFKQHTGESPLSYRRRRGRPSGAGS